MNRPVGCVSGIDVSSAQGVVDWQEVYASGVRVAFVEIFLGNDGISSDARVQVANALKAGLRVLPYFFAYPLPADGAHPGRDPVSQVAMWLQAMKGLGLDPKEPCIIDVEWPPQADFAKWKVDASFVRGWVLAACAELEAKTAVVPWVYITPDFAHVIDTAAEPAIARYPLWIANYEVSEPDIPAPWTAYSAWQHTSEGRVPGVEGPVDLDWVYDPRNAPTDPDMFGAVEDDEVTLPGTSTEAA